MKKSRELNMSIPELTDKIDVREISENFELIDKILSANLIKRNTSTTEINVTAYPPYYIMKNTEDTPIDYFEHIFEETFTLEPLEEKKFFINAPQSVYITSDVQIEYDYFIPVQEAINDISSGITSNYEELDNQPQINGNVLSGNKTASDLGLADINDIPDISSSENNGNIKINGTETTVYVHPSGTNPHGTTKSDVGLGNVPNVATNDQTPSYTEASSLAKLTSGEKLSVAFGKTSKAVTDLMSHLADSVKHITSAERTNWNAAKTKADTNETNLSTLNDRISKIENRVTTISHVYGYHIDGNNSNPSTRVTYIEDAIGMKPAFMNYETGKFDYGSWGNAWFMPRPCMLKSDGTVAYYLDPMDYSKKIDGTESDIANDDFDGNAMMEWGTGGKKIWTKTVPVLGDTKSCYKYFADEQIDSDYHAYSFIGADGKMKDHFYTPIYHGSIVGTKLRSLSGKVPCMSKTAQQEINLAVANGDGWYVEQLCDIELINDLLVLIGKSTDTQTVFGKGNCDGYENNSSINYGIINSGTMDDKGLFWGSNVSSASARNGVKIFGMENWWGNQWRRFSGLILDNGIYKTKMCYGVSDCSTVKGYNLTGDGYVYSGITPGGASGGYINTIDYSNRMSLPKTASGSSSTYYCDGLWFDNSIVAVAFRGGRCGYGAYCGTFSLHVSRAASYSHWDIGAALSYKLP